MFGVTMSTHFAEFAALRAGRAAIVAMLLACPGPLPGLIPIAACCSVRTNARVLAGGSDSCG
jgi:hypothetical protein